MPSQLPEPVNQTNKRTNERNAREPEPQNQSINVLTSRSQTTRLEANGPSLDETWQHIILASWLVPEEAQ